MGQLSGGNIPLFGDTNTDGIISDAENAALSVTLNLDGNNVTDQIGHVADLAVQLHAAGIDYIGVNASDAGNITITDDQASLLVGAGLAFADAGNVGDTPDQITMEASASGTHLKTSLQDLQKLGVDTVLVTGDANSVTVDLGGVGGGIDMGQLSGGNIPLFGDTDLSGTLTAEERQALTVTLNLNGSSIDTQISEVVNVAQQLHDAGVDYIGINGNESGTTHITQDQATLLIDAGLAFSIGGDGATDHITMDVSAEGTHLKTSLQDLQKLGVTNVSVEGSSATVDLGAQGLNVLDGNNLPAFGDNNFDGLDSTEDAALTVTLDLGLSASSLLPNQDDPIYNYLASHGVDKIVITESLNADGSGWINLDELQAIHNETVAADPEHKGLDFEVVTSGSSDFAPNELLIKTLSDTGVMNVFVDAGNVKIGDTLAKALVDSGMLHALPEANVALVYQPAAAEAYAYLNTSLKDMAALGVDSVDYSATTKEKVYVNFGLPEGDQNALNDVKTILETLMPQDPSNKVFSQGTNAPATALVVNDAFYETLLKDSKVDPSVVDGLLKLGISEIDVLVPQHITYGGEATTTQSGSIGGSSVTVNLIGMDDTEYDYLHLKHPNT